jgi:hypothetical protein
MNKKEIRQSKEKFIAELQDQIWRKEMNIAFDLSKIPDIEKLRDRKFKEHADLTTELAALNPTDHTRETREKKKTLEKRVTEIEDFTLSCDETITAINMGVQKERQKSFELQNRIEFAKKFEFDGTGKKE